MKTQTTRNPGAIARLISKMFPKQEPATVQWLAGVRYELHRSHDYHHGRTTWQWFNRDLQAVSTVYYSKDNALVEFGVWACRQLKLPQD